ncbi:MAG: hypothetical protein RML74_02475 [Acidobacteriota bacterium]|nr:hypothetical protein [Acidobacteriota bacterium]
MRRRLALGIMGGLLAMGMAMSGQAEVERDWQWHLIGPYGGEARRLAVDPRHPDRVFVGTCDGQLYLSEDGGRAGRSSLDSIARDSASLEFSWTLKIRKPSM